MRGKTPLCYQSGAPPPSCALSAEQKFHFLNGTDNSSAPHCGKEHDRDVHAAENMLWFAKNKIGVGRTCTLDEIRHSIEDFFNIEGVSLSQEAANPLGWR